MPSITILTSTGPRWGDSSFNSSTAALNVGKTGTPTYYYGYAGFPALNLAWTITSITFKMNRTDSYATHVLQFGSNQSTSWSSKGTLDWHADFSVSSGTGAKSWSLTAYKDIIQGYSGTWYMQVQHGSGSNSYTEFTGGTGSSSPRLVIEYEDSSVTVPGDQFTIGVLSAMTVGNSGSGLTHDLSYSIGAASGTLATGVAGGATVNWTPAATLANQITTDMVGDVTLTLKNYLSGVLQSTIPLTFPMNVPATYVPVITSAPFTLQNPVGDTVGVYVQSRSWTKCTVAATQSYSSPIVEYRVTISGATTTSATNIVTTDVLTQYGVLPATVVVVDLRGQTATWNTASAMTVYQYFAPMVTSFTLLRCDSGGNASNLGTYMKYVVSVSFAAINNLNTKTGTVAFKVAGAPSYGTAAALSTISAYSTTVSGVIGAGGITSSGYMVLVTLTDRYNSTLVEAALASSKLWFDLHSSGEGMAIGKAAGTASLFDVGLSSNFDKQARLSQGFDVYRAVGTQGTAGFVQICTITISASYMNAPLEIDVSQRGMRMSSRLYIRFANLNGTDPALDAFQYTGTVKSVYIARTAAGVWAVYVEKSETYDYVHVMDIRKPVMMATGVTVAWTDIQVAAPPGGATRAINAYAGAGSILLGMQTGSVSTTMPNNTSKTGAVVFPVPYATVPLVFLSFFGSASTYDRPLKYVVQAVSETGFTWMLSYASSSGGAVNIYWLATGDLE